MTHNHTKSPVKMSGFNSKVTRKISSATLSNIIFNIIIPMIRHKFSKKMEKTSAFGESSVTVW